jgi:VanZ family protein
MTDRSGTKARPAAFLGALLLAYIVLVVFASLAPFGPWEPLSELHWQFLLAPLPRYFTTFDVLVNLLAYLPLGALAAAFYARSLPGRGSVVLATLTAGLLSLQMELLQVLLPPRIASNIDLLTNTLGALLGALPWAWPMTLRRSLLPFERLRAHLLLPGVAPEVGASLLLLWCACQLNPSIPFLGAGLLRDPDRMAWFETGADPADWGLQACAAALNACGLGLFLGGLLQPRIHVLAACLLTLVLLLGVKATAAEFLLKPVLAADWFGSATFAGLAAGALCLLVCQRLRWQSRARLAGVCLLAGGLLAKVASHYPSWFGLRNVFGWNFGQLRNFAGLTLWVNELWPLLAVLFLVCWVRGDPAAGRD